MNSPVVALMAVLSLQTIQAVAQRVSEPPSESSTFRVQGKITDLVGFVLPRTEITFRNDQIKRVVTVDKEGFYEADLPLGFYTMTAQAPDRSKFPNNYGRPLFRVLTPTTVTLNGKLNSIGRSCDIRWTNSEPPEDPAQLEDAVKDLCGGEDTFVVASKDGTPFQLHVQYPKRSSKDKSYLYSAETIGRTRVPVFVEYNLFSLEADNVIYDSKSGTLTATGNAVMDDGSGKTQHFDSIDFRFEDGQPILLK